MLDREAAKMREVARVACMIAFSLVSGTLSSAQDIPLGDVARAARAQKSDSTHATKVVTNEDFGPHLEPVAETEDPASVVNKARAALLADTMHTCRHEITNNSGPGSSIESITETAGPDRVHVTINRLGGSDPGRYELIIVGNDIYHRTGNAAWQKDAGQSRLPTPIGGLPEGLSYGSSGFKLVRRETIDGSPTFLYEDKFRAGSLDKTIDIWVGANDHLPRKTEMTAVTNDSGNSHVAPTITRDTSTYSYGPVSEIKPPM